MADYRVLYFPIKGRAEPIRYMLAHAGQKFDDVRWTMTDEWPKHKTEMPFGQVPVLEYKGYKLAQTKAICRFLGNQLNLHADSHLEAAKLDMLADRTDDLFQPMYPAFKETDPEKKKEIIGKAMQETVVPGTKYYEDWLAKSTSGFFGSKLTWADFYLQNVFVGLRDMFQMDLKQFPNIIKFMGKIDALPNVKKFQEAHPDTPFIPKDTAPPTGPK